MTGWSWPKVVSGAAILAVAAVAGVISYSHIYGLSMALHQSAMVAELMPFGIDGLITVGSVVLIQGGRLGWLGIGPGVALSLFANVESGLKFGWLAAVWAGVPAVSFALACFILENWLKTQAKAKAPVVAPIVTAQPGHAAPAGATTAPPDMTPEATAVTTSKTTHGVSRTRQAAGSGGDMERRARRVIKNHPGITGAELGRAIGASPRTGQRLLGKLKAA